MSEPTVEEQREDVWEILGKARVRAWFCPVRSHRTVEWRGDVAHCTHGTCELTSEDTRPWLRDMAEAIAKAEAERDQARAILHRIAVVRRGDCPDVDTLPDELVDEVQHVIDERDAAEREADELRAEVLTLREQWDAHLAICKGIES